LPYKYRPNTNTQEGRERRKKGRCREIKKEKREGNEPKRGKRTKKGKKTGKAINRRGKMNRKEKKKN
jgi:hypothetical protein